MSLPPNAIDAKTASDAAKLMIQAYFDGLFISQAANAITNAEQQGVFFVVLTTSFGCNIQILQTYLQGLGYVISYPDFGNPNISPFNPAQLFGFFWDNFWNNNEIVNQPTNNPVRMKISWVTPTPIPPPPIFLQNVPQYSSLTWEECVIYPKTIGI